MASPDTDEFAQFGGHSGDSAAPTADDTDEFAQFGGHAHDAVPAPVTPPLVKDEPENKHDLIPAAKAAGKGLWEGIKAGAGAAKDAVVHPLDTGEKLADWMVFSGGPAGNNDDTLMNERTLRSVPVVGPTVKNLELLGSGAASQLTGGRVGQDIDQGKAQMAADDATHAQQSPKITALQQLAGQAVIGPAAANPLVQGADSLVKGVDKGQSATDTAKDVRNSALFTSLMNLFGKGAVAGGKKLIQGGAGLVGKGENASLYMNDDALRGRVNDPATTFEAAQGKLDDAANARLDTEADATEQLKAAQDSAKDAKNIADQARSRYGEKLNREAAVPAHVPSMVDDVLEKQRGVTRDLSKQQMDMLKDVPGKFSLQDLDQKLSGDLGASQVDGHSIAGDKDAAAIAALREMLDPLRPEHVVGNDASAGVSRAYNPDSGMAAPAPEASAAGLARLRQVADDKLHEVYSGPTGAHTARAERAALGFRGGINDILDSQLPNSSEYQAVRGGLAHESDLANRGSKTFGGDNQSAKLESVFNPNSRGDLATLQELDQAHKAGILKELTPMGDAQKLLSNPDMRARAEAWLPEVEGAQRAGEAVDSAKGAVNDLTAKHEPYSGITPDTTQATLRKYLLANAKRPELRTKEAIEALNNDYGTSELPDELAALKVKSALGRGGPQGSRMVQMGSKVGGAVGSLLGEQGAKAGAGIGGLAGGALDYAGGGALKLSMDTLLKASSPGVRAAAQTMVPGLSKVFSDPAAKQYQDRLAAAAERGPDALLSTHLLLQKDPKYKFYFGGE